MTAALCMTACNSNQALQTGIDLANMDTTMAPGTDFYQFATGGWQKAHPLTAEYSRYGSFDQLAENNNKQLRELIEGVAGQKNQPGSVAEMIAQMYASAMDSVSLNKQGTEPIRADLMDIYDCPGRKELWRKFCTLQTQGVSGLFGCYIDADIKDSKTNLVQAGQGGLHMRQKEYYLDNDSATLKIRNAYRQYMSDLMARCKMIPAEELDARVQAVLDIETRLAKASRTATELRDPENNYNKMTIDSLRATFPGIDWAMYLDIYGARAAKDISVGQPEFFHEVEAVWQDTPLQALKDYVAWALIDEASSYLDDETRAISFNFYGKVMSGKQEDRPRWKRAVASTEGALGEAVGQLYVQKYFPAEAKERMVQLVKNLQVALAERINAQEWMSDSAKAVACEKLDAFIVKVGYPDKWKDYSGLEIGPNYWQNMKNATRWAIQDMVARKLNKPVDNTEWYMTPQTVNAYYNPTTNEICFPAGILQKPFFDPEADDAVNYGGIGVVIGHEMSHGFDDQGSMFDAKGNMENWWTPADKAKFDALGDKLAAQFDVVEVLPGVHANGRYTLGENIGDHGGLSIAFTAMENALKGNDPGLIDGFTPAQRFYLSYGNIWAQNITDQEKARLTNMDPHSLAVNRVNVSVRNFQSFFDAFDIHEGDPMFRPEEERVHIW